jgi:hypothetical protein
MDDRRCGRGVLCTEALVDDDAVVRGDVVEAVLARVAAGETVSAVATAYDLDRKTVRAWLATQRPIATVRVETPPDQQAQVDFGQRRVRIGG